MFAKAVPLKFAEHRDLKVLETNDYSYARSEVLAPIVFDEMADIAREYPIVFPSNGSGLPAALLGLEAGQNAYIAEDGRWLGTYIPALIRRYPFALAKAAGEADSQKFAVAIDTEAPHFREPNGHAVFTPQGELSDHTKRRAQLLVEIQKKLPLTQRLVADIEAAGLLVERLVRIRKPGAPEHRVSGLRVVDEAKLNALPHEVFATLRDKGVLPLIYAHLLSWANFRQGPIAGKYPDLATRPETKNPSFLFEKDDTIDFSKLS